jgi:hypothetical protein
MLTPHNLGVLTPTIRKKTRCFHFQILTASKIILRRQTETKFVSVMENKETKYCRKIYGVKFDKERDTSANIQYVCTELHGLLSTFSQEALKVLRLSCVYTQITLQYAKISNTDPHAKTRHKIFYVETVRLLFLKQPWQQSNALSKYSG